MTEATEYLINHDVVQRRKLQLCERLGLITDESSNGVVIFLEKDNTLWNVFDIKKSQYK